MQNIKIPGLWKMPYLQRTNALLEYCLKNEIEQVPTYLKYLKQKVFSEEDLGIQNKCLLKTLQSIVVNSDLEKEQQEQARDIYCILIQNATPMAQKKAA